MLAHVILLSSFFTVFLLKDAKENLVFTKCDAVMSAYGLLRNPYLFDPKRTSTPWTPSRGIKTSWEYLQMVKKYGMQRNGRMGMFQNAVRYHLQKFSIAYFESEEGEHDPTGDLWERE